jgi:hypothetical protein
MHSTWLGCCAFRVGSSGIGWGKRVSPYKVRHNCFIGPGVSLRAERITTDFGQAGEADKSENSHQKFVVALEGAIHSHADKTDYRWNFLGALAYLQLGFLKESLGDDVLKAFSLLALTTGVARLAWPELRVLRRLRVTDTIAAVARSASCPLWWFGATLRPRIALL